MFIHNLQLDIWAVVPASRDVEESEDINRATETLPRCMPYDDNVDVISLVLSLLLLASRQPS